MNTTTSSNVPGQPIRSELAHDSDMAEIIEIFVDEMQARIAQLEDAWRKQSMDSLRRIAHQLKGASGGYGFTTVGDAAGRMERHLMLLAEGSPDVSLDHVRQSFVDLVDQCRRVSK